MAQHRLMASDVAESTPYDNYVDRTDGLAEREPPPPKNAKPTYPVELKVHFQDRSHVEAFAKKI